MRITIILAFSAILLFSTCNTIFARNIDDIGQSSIAPDSPFYFLKAIREALETKLAITDQVKEYRQIEFATRRLREIKTLISDNHQELIQASVERYWFYIDKLPDSSNVIQAITLHLRIFEEIYKDLENPKAKMAIRLIINKLSKKAEIPVAVRIGACKFLAKEASSSALNQVEKAILSERADKCFKL